MVLKDRIARSFLDGEGLTVLLIVILVVAIVFAAHPFFPAGIALFEPNEPPVEPKLAISEFYKLALTAIIGGSIGLLIRLWEQQRQRLASEHALLHDFHQRYIIAYNTAKKARRMLRAKSTKEGTSWSIDLASYDEIMSDLEDAQLQFETLRRESQTKRPILGAHYDEIASQLSRSEKYLREVLHEYENKDRHSKKVTLDGKTLPFFIRRDDARAYAILGRERVDTELFDPTDIMEQRLMELMLRRHSPEGKPSNTAVGNR